jgi:hypothetical protein
MSKVVTTRQRRRRSPGNDTTTTTAGPGVIDPCALVTAAEIEAATGVAFADGAYNESLSDDDRFGQVTVMAGGDLGDVGEATVQVAAIVAGNARARPSPPPGRDRPATGSTPRRPASGTRR